MVFMPVITATWKVEIRSITVLGLEAWLKMVEHLRSNCRALNSNPVLQKKSVGCWWLMPLILATREAEMERMVV
jgi:hypothetical protein